MLAVSPIDGRYRARTRALTAYFSEYALIKYRVRVEIEWYLSLAANPAIDALAPIAEATARRLHAIHRDFSLADANRVKQLEAVTNHDVKAVEYFLREKIAALDCG
ncbi:MAG: adenylosuccinate lyase, partial [Candidatus Binataceae bacterium]